jgi:hypothetical protein
MAASRKKEEESLELRAQGHLKAQATIPLWPDTWARRHVGEAIREKQFGTPKWMFESYVVKKSAQELLHDELKVHEAVHGARWYEDKEDAQREIRGG